tara:strand:- start:996 stop:1490 length:495 start_codon:yes stop_codon:yes gene_type:complete
MTVTKEYDPMTMPHTHVRAVIHGFGRPDFKEYMFERKKVYLDWLDKEHGNHPTDWQPEEPNKFYDGIVFELPDSEELTKLVAEHENKKATCWVRSITYRAHSCTFQCGVQQEKYGTSICELDTTRDAMDVIIELDDWECDAEVKVDEAQAQFLDELYPDNQIVI